MLTLFMGLSLISGIMEMQFLGGSGDQTSVLQRLLDPSFSRDYFGAIGAIFTFDYAFFTGAYNIIKWVVFMPIAIATYVGIGLAVIRGVGSS